MTMPIAVHPKPVLGLHQYKGVTPHVYADKGSTQQLFAETSRTAPKPTLSKQKLRKS